LIATPPSGGPLITAPTSTISAAPAMTPED
jgi:hypothetical protein